MNVISVNLYNWLGINAPEGSVARLTCYNSVTSDRVSSNRKKPAVLIMPGGAYRWTSPREAEPVALRFLAKGYSVFVLEYSCAPFSFPTSLREAAAAMRYIRENAAQYEVDPTMVAALGFSAGGHLCGTLGTMFDCPEIADIATPEMVRPDALCLCYPVSVSHGKTHEESFRNISGGDEKLAKRLSLDNLIRPDMPPVFLWHTRDDQSVPVRGSLILAQKFEENGLEYAVHIHRHGQHGLSTADDQVYPVFGVPESSPYVKDWLNEAVSFFSECGFKITDTEGPA